MLLDWHVIDSILPRKFDAFVYDCNNSDKIQFKGTPNLLVNELSKDDGSGKNTLHICVDRIRSVYDPSDSYESMSKHMKQASFLLSVEFIIYDEDAYINSMLAILEQDFARIRQPYEIIDSAKDYFNLYSFSNTKLIYTASVAEHKVLENIISSMPRAIIDKFKITTNKASVMLELYCGLFLFTRRGSFNV